jgi:primosomal replication protein N
LGETGSNRVLLDARLAHRADLRYTPAGIPALDCTLHHRSVQAEAGGERRVECEMPAVAFGDTARGLSGQSTGTLLRCEGFLARRYRDGPAVVLHITRFETRKES